MPKPTVLLQRVSPNGNITALVEQDERVAYFYLQPRQDTGLKVRSCWIRNLVPAPEEMDVTSMREGRPPLMPRAHCARPDGEPPLARDTLRVVWSEEGDAAALYSGEELLAAVPGWSGEDGFHGFSRACVGDGPEAWELGTPETNACFERFQKAAEFWALWNDKEFWPNYRDRMLEALESVLGRHSKYFSIDGGAWPPKALVQFDGPARTVLVTIGMSIRPQPAVERYLNESKDVRRIELAVSLPATTDPDTLTDVARYLSAQSGYPWQAYTWLGSGHTLPADAFSRLSASQFGFALLSNRLPQLPSLSLPSFRDDPISILWLLPISENERTFAMNNGSPSLLQRLAQVGDLGEASFARQTLQVL